MHNGYSGFMQVGRVEKWVEEEGFGEIHSRLGSTVFFSRQKIHPDDREHIRTGLDVSFCESPRCESLASYVEITSSGFLRYHGWLIMDPQNYERVLA